MLVSSTASTPKTVSAPEESNVTRGDTTASPQNIIRRSSRKRIASTRYDAECFRELQEEPEVPHEQRDPRTPQENDEKCSKKSRTRNGDDDEYVPGENNDDNSQESEISDEESA